MKSYPGLWRAKVEENDDSGEEHPYYAAVRVRVIEIHGEELPKKQLPWAYAMVPFGQGKDKDGYDYCSINVPKENSWVWVMFEHGDPNRPVYLGGWIGGEDSELPDIFREDDRDSSNEYPDIKGWTFGFDGGSFSLRIVGDQRLEIFFDENNIIEIDSEGIDPNDEKQICVRSEWLIRLKSDKKIKFEAPEMEFDIEGELKMDAGVTNINGSTLNVNTGAIVGNGAVSGSFEHPQR